MSYTLRGKVIKTHPYQLDPTHTVEGAAAEAKATGERFKDNETLAGNHFDNVNNPHNVTKEQLGLGNVDNTPDSEKPVSVLQLEAIEEVKRIAEAAQTAAENAQTAAENAQSKADEGDKAFLKTGGTMEGSISMNGHALTDLPEPTNDSDPVTKKFFTDYVNDKRFVGSALLTADGWTGETAPYTQTVTVEGILEADRPHIAPVYTSTLQTAIAEMGAWSCVNDAEANDGSVSFYCFDKKPEFNITVQIEVLR